MFPLVSVASPFSDDLESHEAWVLPSVERIPSQGVPRDPVDWPCVLRFILMIISGLIVRIHALHVNDEIVECHAKEVVELIIIKGI